MKEKITLYYNNTTVKVDTVKFITGKLKDKLDELAKNKPIENDLLIETQKVLLETPEDEKEGATLSVLKSGKIAPEDLARYNEGFHVSPSSKEISCFYYEFFRTILDLKHGNISDELKATLSIPVTVDGETWDFWQDQNYEVIKDTVFLFRKKTS